MSDEKIEPSGVTYGRFWPRFWAFIIDGMFISMITWLISFLILLPYYIYNPFEYREWWYTFPAEWLIGFLYFWFMESLNKGQTIGPEIV